MNRKELLDLIQSNNVASVKAALMQYPELLKGSYIIHAAVRTSNLAMVKLFPPKSIIDINEHDEMLYTPLHIAAESGDLEIVRYLVTNYDVDVEKFGGMNACNAADMAESSGFQDIAKFLSEYHNSGFPLHAAVEKGNMSLLKSLTSTNKYSLREKNRDGDTLMHIAVKQGNIQMIQLLLTITSIYSSDPNNHERYYSIKNNDGNTALGLARENKNDAAVNCFLEYSTKSAGKLYEAVMCNHFEKVKIIYTSDPSSIFAYNDYLDTVLHVAVERGCSEIVKYFFEQSNFLNSPEFSSYTRRTNNNGDNILHIAVKKGYIDIVKLLTKIPNIGLINEQNKDGNTALHLAVDSGNSELVMVLIEQGADLSIKNNVNTPPFINIMSHTYIPLLNEICASEKVIKVLLEQRSTIDWVFNNLLKLNKLSDNGVQELYQKLNKHGYKFNGFNHPLVQHEDTSSNSLTNKILKNIYVDIQEHDLKNFFKELLEEGIDIVTKHSHVRDILTVVSEANITMMFANYSGTANARTLGEYSPWLRTISVFQNNIVIGREKIDLTQTLIELLRLKSKDPQAYNETKKLLLQSIIGTIVHEMTHAFMHLKYGHGTLETKPFLKSDEYSKKLLMTLKDKLKLTEIFKNLSLYDEDSQLSEIPAYLYGQGVAATLIDNYYAANCGTTRTLVDELSITLQGMFPELRDFFNKMFSMDGDILAQINKVNNDHQEIIGDAEDHGPFVHHKVNNDHQEIIGDAEDHGSFVQHD
ncbi:MAG: ankyrin repeat domain-containing protein [Rickettsiales bacterium]|nr:ankyrin repeat domain-containing protein [Rickettsiales bacterium]MCA0254769.1 ankyrin repeat domain-containing protein [Pseudomonadota bacterium]